MQALETSYKGYRFRSRLEARWAVFFDTLGCSWEYEREGFDVQGTWYLPDFYLPKLRVYAEVKPTTFAREDFALAFGLARESQGVLLLDGMPEVRLYSIPGACGPCCDPEEEQDEAFEERERRIAARVDDMDLAYRCYLAGHDYGSVHLPDSTHCGRLWFNWGEGIEGCGDLPLFYKAVKAAKSARFEHGESGAPQSQSFLHSRRPPPVKRLSPEYILLMILGDHGQSLAHVQGQLSPEDFSDADLRALYAAFVETAPAGEENIFLHLLNAGVDAQKRMLIAQMVMHSPPTNPAEIAAIIDDCVTKIRRQRSKKIRQRMVSQMRGLPDGSPELQRLVQEYNRLKEE